MDIYDTTSLTILYRHRRCLPTFPQSVDSHTNTHIHSQWWRSSITVFNSVLCMRDLLRCCAYGIVRTRPIGQRVKVVPNNLLAILRRRFSFLLNQKSSVELAKKTGTYWTFGGNWHDSKCFEKKPFPTSSSDASLCRRQRFRK